MNIKLKDIVNEQDANIAPDVAQQKQVTMPVAGTSIKTVQKPVVKTQQKVKTQQAVSEPAISTTNVQDVIYKIKIRLNKLSLRMKMNDFLTSLKDFSNKVTRNTTDSEVVQKYLSPLKGDLQSLKGALESLETDLEKLNELTHQEQ